MFSCARGELFKVFTSWVMVEIIDGIVGYLPNWKEKTKMNCKEGMNNSKGKGALIGFRKPRVVQQAEVIQPPSLTWGQTRKQPHQLAQEIQKAQCHCKVGCRGGPGNGFSQGHGPTWACVTLSSSAGCWKRLKLMELAQDLNKDGQEGSPPLSHSVVISPSRTGSMFSGEI